MDMQDFLASVQKHAGSSEKVARRAAIKTLEVFGQLLTRAEQRAVANQLPDELAEAVQRHNPGRDFDIDEFYNRIQIKHDAAKSFQMEHAQAVMETLANWVDYETRTRLTRHLPDAYGELLSPREIQEVHGPDRYVTRDKGRKLSSGKPGSKNPLNEATSDAHSNSVARSGNPYGERKLSTGKPSPNEGHDLATGRPDGKFVPPKDEVEDE